jgi:flagellar FliL protein
MATAATNGNEDAAREIKPSSKLFLVLSLLLCLLGGGLGFYGVSSGLLPLAGAKSSTDVEKSKADGLPDVAFVDVPTLIVTLPPGAENDHLRFSAKIEVPSEYENDVEFLMPRIQDLMNGYLRALTAKDIEGPGALFRIRVHLFQRVLMVVGKDKANGLLVTEFILR